MFDFISFAHIYSKIVIKIEILKPVNQTWMGGSTWMEIGPNHNILTP